MSEPIRYPIPAALVDLARARHGVIEASAGTGKTFVMEHRVVDLVLRGAADIDQILVVTFTEKATAELRERVRALLCRLCRLRQHAARADEPHWAIDAPARARLGAALLGFDCAAIHTIHGFCHRVLADNPFASQRPFVQTQVAGAAAFSAAFTAVLRDTWARAPQEAAYLTAWLRSGRSLEELEEILFECAERGGKPTPGFDGQALGARLRAAAREFPGMDRASLCRDLGRAGMRPKAALAVAERVAALAALLQSHRQHQSPLQFLVELEGMDKKLLRDLAAKLAALELTPSLAAVRDYTAGLARAAPPLVAAVTARFLPAVLARARSDRASRGLLDYQDMLALLWETLCRPGGAGLAARLRARYRHALIDEFQDTDPLQWKILAAIFLAGGESSLCVVGDPKQAIYGFRGADVATYFAARRDLLAAGAAEIVLARNYRSTASCVEACNHIFADRSGTRFFSGDMTHGRPATAATDLVARDAAGAMIAPIDLIQVVGSEGQSLGADILRCRHGEFIAREISLLLSDPGAQIAVGPPGRETPITASDILVLTRSGRDAETIANYLCQARIPCALHKEEGLFCSVEATEVRDLLAALADPQDPAARFRAWQTRFFAIELADLPRLAALPDTHPPVAQLYDWAALAGRLAYEELFAAILCTSGFIEREIFFAASQRSIDNVLHLFELLLQEVVHSRCSVRELIGRLQRWIDDAGDGRSQGHPSERLDSDEPAVRVMTIHKAKGLEAKVVFLYGGFGTAPPREVNLLHREGKRLLCLGAPGGQEARALKEESEAEDQRLIYVALTRAIARLYLPYVDPQRYRRPLGSLAALNRRLDTIVGELATNPAVARGFRLRRIPASPPPLAAPAADPGLLATWNPPAKLLSPSPADARLGEWKRARRGFVVTSYTRMRSRAQASRQPAVPAPADGDGSDAASLPEDHLPGGAKSGLFLHDLLQRLPFASILESGHLADWRARADIDALFRQALLRHDVDPRYLRFSQQLLYRALTREIATGEGPLPGLAHCQGAVRECEFVFPLPDGRGFVKGFMDFVFSYRGKTYVVDWKSDALVSWGPAALREHVARHYRVQAEVYNLALAKMLAIDDPGAFAARFGGVLFSFLRGPATHLARPAWDELRTAPERIGEWVETT